MVVRTIEVLLEYICLMLCLHNVTKKDIKINFRMVSLFLCEWTIMQAISCGILSQKFKIFVHCFVFLYIKKELAKTWNDAIKIYGIMLIIIMSLQIMGYYILRACSSKIVNTEYTGILINLLGCVIIFICGKRYKALSTERNNSIKYVIIILIFLIVLFRILYLCICNDIVDYEIVAQFGLESLGLCVASMLWINSENENKHKLKELQMYELYSNAFEETIATIRTRQHEFENHLNAIKCMGYTIKDKEQLVIAQEQYCNEILQDNEINKLLKIQLDPILVGFIYSKIMMAKEKDIVVVYNINCGNVKQFITIYELVELVGILFDNAVEAVMNENERIIRLSLTNTDENCLWIEVANNSRMYKNNEIENFCKYGYSTKGEKRGVGLARVKEIVEKNKAELLIRNMNYKDNNYLSFRICFGDMEK